MKHFRSKWCGQGSPDQLGTLWPFSGCGADCSTQQAQDGQGICEMEPPTARAQWLEARDLNSGKVPCTGVTGWLTTEMKCGENHG